jgi:hypothetical protein
MLHVHVRERRERPQSNCQDKGLSPVTLYIVQGRSGHTKHITQKEDTTTNILNT